MDLLYILRYYSTACVYFSFRWGPFVHSLGIVQWNFSRRDHPRNPGRVSGSGLVNCPFSFFCCDREFSIATKIVDFMLR